MTYILNDDELVSFPAELRTSLILAWKDRGPLLAEPHGEARSLHS